MKPVFAAIAFICLALGCETTTGGKSMPQAEVTLPEIQAIAGYRFGESREPLTDVHDMVTESLANDARRRVVAADLAALLHTDATLDAKLFACRELARAGSEENVAMIAPLLSDPQTADMARYALEPIPGRAADKALIDALETAPDEVKVGIINSLGARHATRAAGTLRSLSGDSNASVAAAARDALEGLDS